MKLVDVGFVAAAFCQTVIDKFEPGFWAGETSDKLVSEITVCASAADTLNNTIKNVKFSNRVIIIPPNAALHRWVRQPLPVYHRPRDSQLAVFHRCYWCADGELFS